MKKKWLRKGLKSIQGIAVALFLFGLSNALASMERPQSSDGALIAPAVSPLVSVVRFPVAAVSSEDALEKFKILLMSEAGANLVSAQVPNVIAVKVVSCSETQGRDLAFQCVAQVVRGIE